jgi:hypothetical protein
LTRVSQDPLMSSLVVILKKMRYVWNEVRPRTDQIDKKQVTTSMSDPHESFNASMNPRSS